MITAQFVKRASLMKDFWREVLSDGPQAGERCEGISEWSTKECYSRSDCDFLSVWRIMCAC